jgi:hypothetical protein
MSSLLVYTGVHRLEIQSVMLVFSTQLCKLLPHKPSLLFTFTSKYCTLYTDSVWLGGGGGC